MPLTKPGTKQPYDVSEFYVGATIEVYGHRFELQDADTFVFNYMEANPSEFPLSDLDAIGSKLERMLQDKIMSKEDMEALFKTYDKDGSGYLSIDEFRDVVIGLGFNLTEQEIITLVRRYDLDGNGQISYEEFCIMITGRRM
jgi:Ca2+-binding EF-hand superfamily protein